MIRFVVAKDFDESALDWDPFLLSNSVHAIPAEAALPNDCEEVAIVFGRPDPIEETK
jgi:hypothetical protein